MAPRTAQALWEGWSEAIAKDQAMSARAHADTLLDTLRYFGKAFEPNWSPTQKAAFLNWCDEQGLIKPIPK